MYNFGHGLSYTTYDYGIIKASALIIHRGETIHLSVTVKNSGNMDGKETVQWYVHDPVCKVTRPIKELRHFEKRLIPKGKCEVFTFDLNPEDHLSYVDADGNRFVESGDYYIMVKDMKIKITLVD